MSTNVTPILHLNLPPFDSAPWDEDVNDNFAILDGAIAQVFGVANFAGLWKNSTLYLQGQEVIDETDSSFWMCNITHTSLAPPATFADERLQDPPWWTQVGNSAADYAQAAADSAASAIGANSSAQQAASAAASSATAAAGSANSAASTLTNAVLRSGDTMTGQLTLHADPTTNLMAATKQYVDARVGGVGFVRTTGDTMTGPLILPEPTASNVAATKNYVDVTAAKYLPLTGGTLSGDLAFSGGNQWLTNGTAMISDGNYFQFRFSSDGWRWLYARASGYLYYQNWAGANLFYISSNGDIVANATVYGSNVYSYGNSEANWLHSRGNANIDGTCIMGDCISNGNVHSAGYIWSDNGRIISRNGPASVCCWDTANNAAGGIHQSGGTLHFSPMDGAANPGTSWAWVDGSGLYVNGNGGYATRITSDGSWMYYFWGANFRWQWNNSNGSLGYFSAWINNFALLIDAYGSLTVAANASKPGGGPWNALSDARTKTVVRPYDDSGLTELLQLKPVWYTYNSASNLPDTTKQHVGMVAQDTENIMPELVSQAPGKIGNQDVTDLRSMDTTPLIYAVINALHEINARLEALENA